MRRTNYNNNNNNRRNGHQNLRNNQFRINKEKKKKTENTATMTYFRKKEHTKEVKFSIPTAAVTWEKKYVLIFNGSTSKESYLEMVHEFSVLLETYPLMLNEANASNTANAFQECLRGASKSKFNDILTVPITYASFTANYQTLTESILEPYAVRDQLAYLRKTQKPGSLTMEEWIDRIETINALFPYMEPGINKLNDEQSVEEVIIPNLPGYLSDDFELSY